ncbi:uncharacterized protein LOC116434922 [Nomia melanderi]|uniref:uncharacterized protein LOC116434922 n=1 Tax=Nomia melanderi TaxID=2448451 RepID=UPI003FCEA781
MGRRIRDVFNCFKIASIIEENKFWKRGKEVGCRKRSNRVSFDPEEEMFGSVEQDSEDDESLRMDFQEDLDGTIDWTLESVKIEQKKGRLTRLRGMQENKIDIDLNKGRTTLRKDDEGGDSDFEYSVTGRMSGGAEFRGNRLISDFGEKIQKICLYKTVKFDAKNVRRRLDACIAELNGIIDDIILIFPDRNASTI